MKRPKGLTIIQLMLILLIAGIVASFVVKVIKDERCKAEPTRVICAKP